MRLHQNPTAIVTGRVEPGGDGFPPSVVTSEEPYLISRPTFKTINPLATGNMGCALRISYQVGDFDENLFTAEDNEWGYRALRSGISIQYAPEVIVKHYHWREASQLAENYLAYAWGQGAFYGKHLRFGDWSMIIRISISLYRTLKDIFHFTQDEDSGRSSNVAGRVVRLLQGVSAGFRGFKLL